MHCYKLGHHWGGGYVQAQLFSAMRKVRLVPEGKTWQELNYSRCGRTDKGVSALEQVGAQASTALSRFLTR